MNDAARAAVYYVPDPDDPLAEAGARWLGREVESDAPVAQPAIRGIAEVTAEARRYGFHATLKPPMRLIPGTRWDDVAAAADALAGRIAPFALPALAIADVHGFLALRETAACPELQALADCCVAELDAFRAPPDAAELDRRRRAGLDGAQEAMLRRWGYPYVFGTWFFHMTVTKRLDQPARAIWAEAAAANFAPALALPRRVGTIALFTEAGPGAPFRLALRLKLRG